MNYGEARKLMFDNKEKEVILDLVKSAQEQIEKIPKSFFQINTSVLQAYDTQVKMLSAVADSEFVKNAFKIAQKQIEVFSSLNNNFLYTNRPIEYKNILPIRDGKIEEIEILKDEVKTLKKKIESYESRENNLSLEINSFGNFLYKGKFLKISTDNNQGKFLRIILENENHFISDKYCQSEFNCPTTKEITYIIRDLNKILSKDNLKVKLRRCRDAKGYILEGITETKS